MSVDIWAVGVIALTLLLGREVFPTPARLSSYIHRQRPLDFSRGDDEELTELCRDFITSLLAPDPIVRPTAIATLSHPWLIQGATPPPDPAERPVSSGPDHGDLSPSDTKRHIKPETREDQNLNIPPKKPRSQPDTKTVVKQEETKVRLNLYPTKSPATIQRMHTFLALDSILLAPKFRGLSFDRVCTWM